MTKIAYPLHLLYHSRRTLRPNLLTLRWHRCSLLGTSQSSSIPPTLTNPNASTTPLSLSDPSTSAAGPVSSDPLPQICPGCCRHVPFKPAFPTMNSEANETDRGTHEMQTSKLFWHKISTWPRQKRSFVRRIPSWSNVLGGTTPSTGKMSLRCWMVPSSSSSQFWTCLIGTTGATVYCAGFITMTVACVALSAGPCPGSQECAWSFVRSLKPFKFIWPTLDTV